MVRTSLSFPDRAHHPLLPVPIGLCKYSEYKIRDLCHTNFKVYLSSSPCTRLTSWSAGTVTDPLSPHMEACVSVLHYCKATVQMKPCLAQQRNYGMQHCPDTRQKYVEWTKECCYRELCNVKGKQFCLEGTINVMVGFLLRVFGKGGNYSILGYDLQRVATLWEQWAFHCQNFLREHQPLLHTVQYSYLPYMKAACQILPSCQDSTLIPNQGEINNWPFLFLSPQ